MKFKVRVRPKNQITYETTNNCCNCCNCTNECDTFCDCTYCPIGSPIQWDAIFSLTNNFCEGCDIYDNFTIRLTQSSDCTWTYTDGDNEFVLTGTENYWIFSITLELDSCNCTTTTINYYLDSTDFDCCDINVFPDTPLEDFTGYEITDDCNTCDDCCEQVPLSWTIEITEFEGVTGDCDCELLNGIFTLFYSDEYAPEFSSCVWFYLDPENRFDFVLGFGGDPCTFQLRIRMFNTCTGTELSPTITYRLAEGDCCTGNTLTLFGSEGWECSASPGTITITPEECVDPYPCLVNSDVTIIPADCDICAACCIDCLSCGQTNCDPVLRGFNTNQSTDGTMTLDVPSLTVETDSMYAIFAQEGDVSISPPVPDDPSWILTNSWYSTSSIMIFSRSASSIEPTSYSWTCDAVDTIATMIVFSQSVQNTSAVSFDTSVTNYDSADLTSPAPGRKHFLVGFWASTNPGQSLTTPAGMTEITASSLTNVGLNIALEVFDGSSTTGIRTATGSTGDYVAITSLFLPDCPTITDIPSKLILHTEGTESGVECPVCTDIIGDVILYSGIIGSQGTCKYASLPQDDPFCERWFLNFGESPGGWNLYVGFDPPPGPFGYNATFHAEDTSCIFPKTFYKISDGDPCYIWPETMIVSEWEPNKCPEPTGSVPYVVSEATTAYASGQGITINVPEHADGDLLVTIIYGGSGAQFAESTGWDGISSPTSGISHTSGATLETRVHVAGESPVSSSYTFQYPSGSADIYAVMFAVRNWNDHGFLETGDSGIGETNLELIPSASSSSDGILMVNGWVNDGGEDMTPPIGMTTVFNNTVFGTTKLLIAVQAIEPSLTIPNRAVITGSVDWCGYESSVEKTP